MILNINGRNMQITDSIRAHVEKKAAKLERFFRPDTEVQVRISQERGGRNIAEVTVALRGVILRAEEVTNDMYASIDTAIDKMVRQIRRHRTKLEKGLRAGAFEPAAAEEVVPEDEVEEIDGSPEEENPDEPTGILPDEENMETETLEIDDELHHLPPEDEVEEID